MSKGLRWLRVGVVVVAGCVLAACNTGFGRSGNADLSRLVVERDDSTLSLNPTFRADETEYSLRVAQVTSTVTFNVTSESDKATMTLNGSTLLNDVDFVVALANGPNTFDIVVTAENENTKTYEVAITRENESSNNAFLQTLDLAYTSVESEFSSGDFPYADEVNYWVNATYGIMTRANEQATVLWNSENGANVNDGVASEFSALDEGITNLSVQVTAGDETTVQTYTMAVTRDAKSELGYDYIKATNTEAGDAFGTAVASDGDYMVIGSPNEDSPSLTDDDASGRTEAGAAFVLLNSAGVWAHDAYLKANPTPTASDLFGSSVAVSGDTIVVGAPGTNSSAGAAYIYVLAGTDWVFDERITANDAAAGSEFGASVSVSDGVILVGAPGADTVYLFEPNGDDWEQEGDQNGDDDSRFGEVVKLNVGTASQEYAVGAPSARGGQGTVHLYQYESGESTELVVLDAGDNAENEDGFGLTMDIEVNRIVVGAPGDASTLTGVNNERDDTTTLVNAGAAYIFERGTDDADWPLQAFLKAPEQGDTRFGSAVGLSANMVAVGAPNEDSSVTGVDGGDANSDMPDSGAVYVFEFDGLEWSAETYVKAREAAPNENDHFGSVIAFNGSKLIVGVADEDGQRENVNPGFEDGADDSGAVFIIE
ncbi:MAG: cadherin-like beta sandwich domain-containing protein [Agarilytica sp.]